MQVTATNQEGLKRELKIVIAASELSAKLSTRLDELKNQVRLKGFRPGKVPVDHLRRVYGRSVMAEVVQESVTTANQQALTDRKERPAFDPDIKFPEDKAEIEQVMEGKADLTYTVAFEILPEVHVTDLTAIKLERLSADVGEEDIAKGVDNLAESSISYTPSADRKADTGDQVKIDFLGKIDGEPFEGGKADDQAIVIGRGGFIPGFEDGLKGAAAGDNREVKATFPETYPVKTLAGKEAVFEVTVKEVAAPDKPVIDDEFAKKFGLESLAKLRELVEGRIKQEFDQVSRMRIKRALLDELDKRHDIALPQKLVDGEFEAVWAQVTGSLKEANRTFEDEGKTEDSARAEYRKISERRVRLGLVLSEIGEKNEIKVPEEDVRRAMINEARRYPGQERQVLEFYQKNPQAIAQLRAPLFEEKVVDYILELCQPVEKKISRDELLKSEDEPAASA
jgi:trigger factor